MARPIKNGLDYFSHDTDACNDEKIEALRAMFGNDGYAFYFILLERIYKTSDGFLDITNRAIKAAIVKKVGVDNQKFDEMLEVATDIDLFCKETLINQNKITSQGVQKRFRQVDEMRLKWRSKKLDKNTEVVQGVFSRENPIENSLENMGKRGESKEKESKVKESKAVVVVKNEKSDCNDSEDNPEKFYSNNFGLITQHIAENIKHFIDDGVDPSLITQKMKEAVELNIRKWAWVQKALLNLQKQKVKTIEQYDAVKKEFERNKLKSKTGPPAQEKNIYRDLSNYYPE